VSGTLPNSAIYQATVGVVLVTLCLSAVTGALVGIVRRGRGSGAIPSCRRAVVGVIGGSVVVPAGTIKPVADTT